jgi:hypothetical protein
MREVNVLRARAEESLGMRRALGFKLTTQGRHLMSFIRFCEERSADRVTADLAIEWATRTGLRTGGETYQARWPGNMGLWPCRPRGAIMQVASFHLEVAW